MKKYKDLQNIIENKPISFIRKDCYKFLMIMSLAILTQGCAIKVSPIWTVPKTYSINTPRGELRIYVRDKLHVQDAYYKCTKENKNLRGYWDPEKLEIWSEDDVDTIIHEFKHYFEGHWHE